MYFYFKFNRNYFPDPYSYKYPDLQIIKNPQIINFYKELENFNYKGLSIPIGLKKCKLLILLNIATTKALSNVAFYQDIPLACTLEVVQESLGGKKEITYLVENGELAMMDTIPIRIPNKYHINNLPHQIVHKCIDFTTKEIIPIVQPQYVIGFGEGPKLVLKLMMSLPKLFNINLMNDFKYQYNINIYRIFNIQKNFHFYFIHSIHPSSIYNDISIEQAKSLDNTFNFLRNEILNLNPNDESKIFSYEKYTIHKKENDNKNMKGTGVDHCIGKNNFFY